MKIPGWLTLQVAQLAAVGVLVFLLVGQCNRVRTLQDAAAAVIAAQAKDDEAADLRARKVSVAHAVDLAALKAELADQVRAKGYLSDALAAALKVSPHSTPIGSATGSTGPVQADGGAAPPSVPVPAGCTAAPSPPSVQPSVCLLSPGDSGEIRVSGVALRTEAGNVIVAAEAEAWRLNPETRLFGGTLHLKTEYLKPPDPARAPGWGIGLAAAVGRRGWQTGPAVASPPLSLWRLQLDPSAALMLGPGGEFVGALQVIGRWR